MFNLFRLIFPKRKVASQRQSSTPPIAVPVSFRQIICSQLSLADGTEINSRLRFCEDLGCDSLDILQLVVVTEEYYGITINDEIVDSIVTVGDAVTMLRIKNGD